MSGYAHGTVQVTDTAAVLTTSGGEDGGIVVSNRGPVSIYLGGSTVTADQSATGGLELVPGEKVTLSTLNASFVSLYAVTAASTAVASWIAV